MSHHAPLNTAVRLLLGFCVCVTVFAAPPPNIRNGDERYRIPTYVIPISYDLDLEPDINSHSFLGKVEIHVRVNLKGDEDDLKSIYLHGENIEVFKWDIKKLDTSGVTKAPVLPRYDSDQIEIQPLYDYLVFKLEEDLEDGAEYVLYIEYTGELRKDMYGFYETTYIDDDEVVRTVLSTQFQPTSARRAFPCFDEPQFKAKFTLHIKNPEGYHSIGNMKKRIARESEDSTRDHYETTPEMSTYLIAFVISDFKEVNDGGSNPAISTWARENAIPWAAYSIQVSRALLETMETYTGITFVDPSNDPTFDKIDHVAVPDFSAGAMENWGLITYRETALLYNPEDGSAAAKRRVALVIAHELVHMWFGNLVTTKWWDATWLNEAFAEYFEYYAVNSVEPSWKTLDQMLIEEVQNALSRDCVPTAQALTHPVYSPADASASFHSLTYVKGASLVRMINAILGEVNFRHALHEYLTKYKYQTVVPSDLFQELRAYAPSVGLSADDLDALLVSWTEQPGHPIITVIRDYSARTARVSQERYFINPEDAPSSDTEQVWYVPLTWTTPGGSFALRAPDDYLRGEREKTVEGMPNQISAVIFNLQQTGFYRVNYDLDNWALISQYLQSAANPLDGVHVLNRAQLLDDAFSLARSGHISYSVAFDVADYLTRETEYVPWAAALGAFTYLHRVLAAHEKYSLFKTYVSRLVLDQYRRFNFEDRDEHLEKLLLSSATTWACRLGHGHCTSTARDLLQSFLGGGPKVPPDLRSVVYCYGIRYSDSSLWEKLWEKYKESKDDAEKNIIATGLGCSTDEEQLREYLSYSINSEYIRKQDASNVFAAVYNNPEGVNVALEFLEQEFDSIVENYASMSALYNVLTGIAARLTRPEQREKLAQIIENNGKHVDETTAGTALDMVDSNLRWLDKHQKAIFDALETKVLYRLPTSVQPIQYNLHLNPDIDASTYEGKVDITVNVEEATDEIFIHAQDLTIQDENVGVYESSTGFFTGRYDNSLKGTQNTSAPHVRRIRSADNLVKSVESKPQYQLVKISLTDQLVAGQEYIIVIEYSGKLRDDMVGFYKSYYTNDRSESENYFVATKFAPTHARKAFPCFDEPGMKAHFKIEIETPATHHSLANTPRENKVAREDGSSLFVFENTPKMSTYIVAWIVSDLVETKDESEGDIEIRTWSRLNAKSYATYSVNITRDLLQFLETYTDFKYKDENHEFPLRKLDQIGTPDFVSGAMENWGLITYRETALLYNDGTAAARRRVATVIAHELAHMWFGNLVTTKWWDSTWLNEGFASYFEYLVTDSIKPNWGIMDIMVYGQLQSALDLDQLPETRALTQQVITPEDAVASFGSITYVKGGSLLRTLSFLIGENNLREAIRNYVKKNAYAAATPSDLFEHLLPFAGQAGLSEDQFLDYLLSWTEQPGYPVIDVKRYYESNSLYLQVTQERFLIYNEEAPKYQYYIPLSWRTSAQNFDNPKAQDYLTKQESSKTIRISDLQQDQWIIFNVQAMGFFRVNYDNYNWLLIIEQLNSPGFQAIHWLNRAQLADDAFALARAGHLEYDTVFQLVDYVIQENDYVPWAATFNGLAYLDRMLQGRESHERFKIYVRGRLSLQYGNLGFEVRDDHQAKLWINGITTWGCAMGNPDCQNRAVTELGKYLDTDIQPYADLRSVIYCYGVKHGPEAYWSRLRDRLQDCLDEAERALLIAGLGCSPRKEELISYMLWATQGRNVRKQEGTSVFSAVYAQPGGADVVLDFLENHYAAAAEYLGSLTSVLSGAAGRLTTEEQRNRVVAIIAAQGLGSGGSAALRSVDRNLLWARLHRDHVEALLKDRPEPPTEPPTDPPPTEGPTQPPTEGPTEPTTEGPTEPTTEGSTEPTTEGPTEPTTEGPTQPPTEGPTEPTTEGPTEPTTEGSTEPTTEETTEPTTDPSTTPGAGVRSSVPAVTALLVTAIAANLI